MVMKYYIGNTDKDWYDFLKQLSSDDINFWQPGGSSTFHVLQPGAPFLFRLKSPINKIAGVGFFTSSSILPLNYAWEVFQKGNGVENYQTFCKKINGYRKLSLKDNPNIGCIVLSNPIFFDINDWITVPNGWPSSAVQGKSYSTDTLEGLEYWNKVSEMIMKYSKPGINTEPILEDIQKQIYTQRISNVRIGQAGFRVLVTDAYTRRCAISGERTLPVLEAAHIRPYSDEGPNRTDNGLLLRSDLHKLFDDGYITITDTYNVEVSKRIKEEFNNGRDYYKYHGQKLLILPNPIYDQPSKDFLRWHNENVYR